MLPSSKRIVYVLYGGAFLGTILLILVANMFFISRQTKKDFIKMFWRQNGETAEFISLSATQAVDSRHLSTPEINDYLKDLAKSLDRPDLPLSATAFAQLDAYRMQEELAALWLIDDQGRTLAFSPRGGSPPDGPIVAWPRTSHGGVLMLALGPEKLEELQIQSSLQKLADSLREKKVADYVAFIGPNRRILAHTDPTQRGLIESNEGIEASLKDQTTYYYRKDDLYEAVHPFPLGNGQFGALLIGLDSKEFEQIYDDVFENTALFSAWVMLLASLAAALAWRLHWGYTQKIESMQAQVAESEKLVSLGNLAAGVAHEIRNPLNSISITLQRLQLEHMPEEGQVLDADAEEMNFLTDLMQQEVKRINNIVTDFLGFSKPYDPKFQNHSAFETIQQCVVLFRQSAEEQGVQVLFEPPERDDQVSVDKEKLTQVLLNLLKNALDVSPEGGEIRVRSRFVGDQWRIEVIDQGPGIPKEKLKQIFDIYYTTKATGTGLGLFICRKIIQAHQGQIDLKPLNERGTMALVILPKRQALG
ncbi:MAG: ATP-binding protein [bacterium]|nr:ATP-binding protein [bacterium]